MTDHFETLFGDVISAKVLSGIRVVDFGWVVAGPMTTKMLALMGAEVIKIESSTRPEHQKRAGVFNILNNNKLSASINITQLEGQQLLHELVSKSDIVVENFSARVLAKNNLSYDALRQVREDIIYVSASGVGRTGPDKDFVAYGSLLQAYSGRSGLIASANERMEAMGILPIWTDPVTALWETLSILSAIYVRREKGLGCYIDLSMVEATVALLPDAFLKMFSNANDSNEPIGKSANEDPLSYRNTTFKCAGDDEWVYIFINDKADYPKLAALVNSGEIDAILSTAKCRADLSAKISDWCRNLSPRDVIKQLSELGIPAVRSRSFSDAKADEQLVLRGAFSEIGNDQESYTLPWRDADTNWRGNLRPTPELGQDNDYVFRNLLGLSQTEIDRLVEENVIH